MNPIILKRWTEVEPTMLTDKKIKGRVQHILFIDNCEKRKGQVSGKITVSRRKNVVFCEGKTLAEADSKVAEFCDRKGVQLL